MSIEEVDKNQIIRGFFESTKSFTVINTLILILGVFLVNGGSNLCLAIGTSLIASSIVSYGTIWLKYIKTEEERLLFKVKEYGVIGIFENRDLGVRYKKLLNNSNKVDVTGYSLSGFTNQSIDLIKKRNMGENPIKVRILLVDPESQSSQFQETIEGHGKNSFKTYCENVKIRFNGVSHVEIRYASHALPLMIYRLDDIIFTGHYSVNNSSNSSSTLTYEIKSPGKLFNIYISEFEAMWEKATTQKMEEIEC